MDRGIVIGLTSFVVTAAILAIPNAANSQPFHHGGGAMATAPTTRAEVESRIAEHFAETDANGDGAISREEADARHAAMRRQRQDERFDLLDSNDDGEISVAERDAARTLRRRVMQRGLSDMRGEVNIEEAAGRRNERPGRSPETRGERHARWIEHRNEAWTAADADGNGSLDRAEFDAMQTARRERMREFRADAETSGRRRGMHWGNRFERMDTDNDGQVTLAEISERALAMFDRADADGDGTVTPEERRAAHRAMRAERRQNRDN